MLLKSERSDFISIGIRIKLAAIKHLFRLVFALVMLSGIAKNLSAQTEHQFVEIPLYSHANPDRLLISEKFRIYYTQAFKKQALNLLGICPFVLSETESKLDYRLNGKLEIVLSPVHTSSMLKAEKRNLLPVGGAATRVDHKRMTIACDGSAHSMENQLRRGLTEVLVKEMIYGGSVTDKVKNTLNYSVPDWFENGLINYISEGWNATDEQAMRDMTMARKGFRLTKFNASYAQSFNKAYWYFLEQTRGQAAISRLVYLTRLTRSMESSLYFVVNHGFKKFHSDMEAFFLQRYLSEPQRLNPGFPEELPSKIQRLQELKAIHTSKGMILAGLLNQQLFVYQSIESGHWKRLFHESKVIGFGMSQGHQYKSVLFYQISSGKWRFISFSKEGQKSLKAIKNQLDSFKWVSDMRMTADAVWISGTKFRWHDVYRISIESGISERWTHDFELEKEICPSPDGGLFVLKESEVKLSEQPQKRQWNILKYQSAVLSDTCYIAGTEEQLEQLYHDATYDQLYFLSDISGVVNAWAFLNNTDEVIPLSDYARNLICHFPIEDDLIGELLMRDGKYLLVRSAVESGHEQMIAPTLSQWRMKGTTNDTKPGDKLMHETSKELLRPQNLPFLFQNDFPIDSSRIEQNPLPDEPDKPEAYREFPIANTSLITRKVYSGLDNGLLGIKKQSALLSPRYHYRYPLQLIAGIEMSNALQQRYFRAMIRMESQINGTDQLIRYAIRKKQWIWTSQWYRWSFRRGAFLQGFNRYNSNLFELSTTHQPTGLQGLLEARIDRSNTLITDESSLLSKSAKGNELITAGLIWNNNLPLGQHARLNWHLQAMSGWARRKGFGGYASEANFQICYSWVNQKGINASLTATGGTSFGTYRTTYILGGAPNWMNENWRADMQMLTGQEIVWQIIPTMRSFFQNARNGHHYSSYQSEIECFPFSFFSDKPINRRFYQYFSLGIFHDGGVAWYGSTPYAKENPYFLTQVNQPGLELTLYQRKNPFLFSMGCSMGIRLYNYGIKWYAGKGIENSRWNKTMHQITLESSF